MEEIKRRLSVRQVRLRLGLSWPTVEAFILSGDLRAINLSTNPDKPRWYVTETDLAEFLKSRSNCKRRESQTA